MRVAGWPAFKNRRVNPYNWLLYTHLAQLGVQVEEFSPVGLLLGRYDIWHVHWPEFGLGFRPLWRALAWLVAVLTLLAVARIRRVRVVWTIHNLGTHERTHPRLESLFWRLFVPRVDGVIALTADGLRLARERFPKLRSHPAAVVPLGHSRSEYPNEITRSEARSRLGIPEACRVVTFFGQIRPYKNVPSLVQAFRALDETDVRLVIAGEPYAAALANELQAAADSDPRIQLHLKFHSNADVQVFLNAADLVVLPFAEILNSASALLALSFGRPVLVPRRGSMPELQNLVGPEWVCTFDGELDAHTLARALDWSQRPRNGSDPVAGLDWTGIAQRTLDVYRSLLDGSTGYGSSS